MDQRKVWGIVFVVALAAFGIFWFFLGPGGKETVEAIDHTAEQATGKRAVDQGLQMRREAEAISADQKDRLKQLELGLPVGSR